MNDDDEQYITRCEQLGHTDEYVVDEDEYGAQFSCRDCDAEWWEDYE